MRCRRSSTKSDSLPHSCRPAAAWPSFDLAACEARHKVRRRTKYHLLATKKQCSWRAYSARSRTSPIICFYKRGCRSTCHMSPLLACQNLGVRATRRLCRAAYLQRLARCLKLRFKLWLPELQPATSSNSISSDVSITITIRGISIGITSRACSKQHLLKAPFICRMMLGLLLTCSLLRIPARGCTFSPAATSPASQHIQH